MGLYADSLINQEVISVSEASDTVYFSKKAVLTVPAECHWYQQQAFCNFFGAHQLGSITMQMLPDHFWKGIYCNHCRLINQRERTMP